MINYNETVPESPCMPYYSHVWVLERGGSWNGQQPRCGFHHGVGKIQLESFTFTWRPKER